VDLTRSFCCDFQFSCLVLHPGGVLPGSGGEVHHPTILGLDLELGLGLGGMGGELRVRVRLGFRLGLGLVS